MTLFWITLVVLNGCAFFIPKNLPKWQLYTTSVVVVMFQLPADNYFDFYGDLYGYFNRVVYTLSLVYQYGIFPAVNILFLTGWESASKKGTRTKINYIVIWCLLSTLYEYFAVKSGFLYHNESRIGYSLLEYPILFFIVITNFLMTQWVYEKGDS